MSNSPDPLRDDFPDIPESGLLWPSVAVGILCFAIGLYFILTPSRGGHRSEVAPMPAASVPSPSATPGGATGNSRILRFAFVDSSHSSFAFAAEAFARKVSQMTRGKIQIRTMPGGLVDGKKLGELGIVKLIQSGTVAMGLCTTSPLTNYNPRFDVLDLPFLFSNYQQADAVLDGPVGQYMLDGLKPRGLKGLGYLEVGFRIFSSSVPMPTFADFKGKKLRVMQSSTYVQLMKAIGAIPVPSPVDKIYEMGKEGYIDGADRTYPTYWDFKLYQVQRYITETRHTYSTKAILVNLKVFDALDPDTQLALEQAAHYVSKKQRQMQRKDAEKVKAMCRKRGIQIFQLSAADRQKFIQASRPLYAEYVKLHGDSLLKRVRNAEKSASGTAATSSQPEPWVEK